MSTTIIFNGTSYSVPATGDENWSDNLSAYLIAIASGALQKTGGTFTLTAETDFGATYGLKSAYFKSRATNPSSTGIVRLGNNEGIGFRNAANNADLVLKANASDLLEYNGSTIINSGSLTDLITNTMVNSAAAIAYSKLNLATSIVNADISASAAIALSKLAATTVTRALVSDGSGKIATATTTAAEIEYVNGVTSAIQTQIDGKVAKSTLTTKGDTYVATGSATIARQAIGSDGQVLTADSAQTNGLKWATPASAPDSSYELSNLSITTSVAANALTIAIKDKSGSDASAGSPIKIGMRSGTLTSGRYNQRSITSALSMVVSSGSTLGQTDGQPSNIYVYLIDNAGTLELAVSHTLYKEHSLMTTTAEGGAGAADSVATIYSTTARTSVPCRLIGFILNTQTTAGTWTSAGTQIQLMPFRNVVARPTVQRFTSGSGTYYTPAGVTYLKIKMAGGGAGACGSGSAGGGTGGNGGNTTFGSSLLTANGATGPTFGAVHVAGGSATVNSPALAVVSLTGGTGAAYSYNTPWMAGGNGGSNPFGGAGTGSGANFTGNAAISNTGAGGAGGSNGTSAGAYSGTGGGAGGYIEAIIIIPLSSYAYAVGSGGSGGTAGTAGNTGGAGGSGVIIVEEYYD